MSEPCRQATLPGEVIGAPCEVCGHTNVAHPGAHNPALTDCVICMLAEAKP